MSDYLQLKVSLQEVKPAIWRRFLLRKAATFQDLHEAIQDACGWEDYHLFEFLDEVGGVKLASSPDDEEGGRTADEVKLASVFKARGPRHCVYLYDFGDYWLHDVELERSVRLPDAFLQRLLDGARAFPKEDCGGVPGYEDCVTLRKTGKDPRGIREWLEDWQPEAFDVEAARAAFDLDRVPGR